MICFFRSLYCVASASNVLNPLLRRPIPINRRRPTSQFIPNFKICASICPPHGSDRVRPVSVFNVPIEMVCLDTSISVHLNPNPSCSSTMSKCNHVHPKSKNRKTPNSTGGQKIQSCEDWQFVIIDVVMLIAVVGAVGCLLFPYAKIVTLSFVRIVRIGFSLVKEEFVYAPGLYASLALGMICATVASLTILICMDTNCGRPGCKSLRKTGTFDIQVQTEEDLRNSSSNVMSSFVKDVVKEGMSRFRREHIRELELRLRKLAPSNGKAVLVYRSGCGCIAGKLEVSGPRTLPSRGNIKK